MNYKKLFLDFFMLTFSVLLAFLLNSWNEDRKEKNEAQLYLNGIFEEIDYNIIELDTTIVYHKDLLKKLKDDPRDAIVILKPASLSNEAWVLSENDVFKKHVHKGLYKKLAQGYHIHEKLTRHSDYASEIMANSNIFGPYYMAEVLFGEPDEENMEKFRKLTKSGWVPIFQDWCYYGVEYLKILKEIKSEYSIN